MPGAWRKHVRTGELVVMAPVSFLILARLGPRLVLNRLQRAANGGFAIAQPARGLSGKTLLGRRCGAPGLGPPSPWAPTSLEASAGQVRPVEPRPIQDGAHQICALQTSPYEIGTL